MKTILTSLSPNTEVDDVLLSLKLGNLPFSWKGGPYLDKLATAFGKWLSTEHVFLFESGRSSLYAILKTLDLKPSDEVLLQAYTCVAVPDPVLWVGAKPVYVDVETGTLNIEPSDIERKISKNSKVLIIQHTFGNPANLEELLKIAKKYNLFVIEDCAHAMGAEYHEKKVGTFGEAAFFSTGRDKVISSVFGGIVTTNNKKVAERLREIHSSAPYPSRRWVKQQLNHPSTTSLAKLLYNSASLGKALMKISLKTKFISYAVNPEEKRGGKPDFILHKMPNSLADLAYKQFQKLDRFNNHRVMIAQIYGQNLDQKKYLLPKISNDSKSIFLRYTILTPKAEEIRKKGNKVGIVLGDWYTQAIAPEGVDYKAIGYDPKSCPNAEKAALQSLNLPTHIGIREQDAYRVVEYLNNF